MATITSGTHTFELVDYVPKGYEIWNIGKNMADGYLPLCRIKEGTMYEVEVETLKAIPIAEAQTILKAVGGGVNTVEKMERYLKQYSKAKKGGSVYYWLERIQNALPIMKQIKWEK